MNARTIIAADGLPRRAFTVKDVELMVEVGLIGEDERIELIEGELIPTSPKGIRHEVIKGALLRRWYGQAPDDVQLIPETTFRLSADTYLEADVCIYTRARGLSGLDGGTALLVVEIAASSLGYDLGRKAAVYAGFGVRELWVVDARAMAVHVRREPREDGYGSVTLRTVDDLIVPVFAPAAFALRLAELDFGPDADVED